MNSSIGKALRIGNLVLAIVLLSILARFPFLPSRRRKKFVSSLSKRKQKLWLAKHDIALDRDIDKCYDQWIFAYDRLSPSDRDDIRRHIAELPYKPLISIVMVAYRSHPDYFRQALNSIDAQLYSRWELCIAHDASLSPDVNATLLDPRIKWRPRTVNSDSSAAVNAALQLTTGEFVVFMDHDDLLSEHALYRIIVQLNSNPDVDLIFSDEDRIDASGRRCRPYFKPGWNPELFLTHNLIGRFGVYRRAIVQQIGGFREGLEASQDYDLALRFLRETSFERVSHIPEILYHLRVGGDGQDICQREAIRVVNDHFAAIGDGRRAVPHNVLPGCGRILRPAPYPVPKVSVIVPTKDRGELLGPCLDGVLKKTDYEPLELIIVDHETVEPKACALLEAVARDPRVKILPFRGEFNYSELNNMAVAAASGSVLCFLNNDIEVVESSWLAEMVNLAIQPGNGAVGAKLLYPNKTIQHAGVIVGLRGSLAHGHCGEPASSSGYFGDLHLTRNVSIVTGACLVIRKQLFDEAGGFDQENLKVTFNDADLCLAIEQRGLLNVWTPYATLIHHESPTRGKDNTEAKQRRCKRELAFLREKYPSQFGTGDKYYNRNLSTDDFGFHLAFDVNQAKPWNLSSTLLKTERAQR